MLILPKMMLIFLLTCYFSIMKYIYSDIIDFKFNEIENNFLTTLVFIYFRYL